MVIVEMKSGLSKEILLILEYGAMAPSGHNTQPWGVKPLSRTEFILLSDKERWLPMVDPDNRELMITMGVFWENVERASRAMGWDVKSNILAKSPRDREVIHFQFSRGEAEQKHYLELMERRAVNRHPYSEKPLDPVLISELELNPLNTFIHRWGDEGEWLADSLVEAARKQTMNDDKQKELSNWLRFSPSEVKEKLDGISPEMLALPILIRLYWYTFYNPESVFSDSFRKARVENVRKQVDNCAGFIVLSSKDNSLSQLLQTGREMERLFLLCTEQEVSLHPLSQILEETPWKDEIKNRLSLFHQPQMVIRAGYHPKNEKTSMRRKVEDIIHP